MVMEMYQLKLEIEPKQNELEDVIKEMREILINKKYMEDKEALDKVMKFKPDFYKERIQDDQIKKYILKQEMYERAVKFAAVANPKLFDKKMLDYMIEKKRYKEAIKVLARKNPQLFNKENVEKMVDIKEYFPALKYLAKRPDLFDDKLIQKIKEKENVAYKQLLILIRAAKREIDKQ